MIVVIQCAGSKQKNAGTLQTKDGAPVKFVAQPELATQVDGVIYARPDDLIDEGESWRDKLLRYNENPGNNPLNLLSACELYSSKKYQQLADSVDVALYILSAGWGLVRADFLVPAYDITFSTAAKVPHVCRRHKKTDVYADFCQLSQDTTEPIIFFGGKDYVPLFVKLTGGLQAKRAVYHKTASLPNVSGCTPVYFETNRDTNWHYDCAKAFLDGKLELPKF